MPTQSNVVLNDGQATPVAHTFSARGASPSLATYLDMANGTQVGLGKITLANKATPGAGGSWKTEARITIPVMEAISGSVGGYDPAPKVAFELFAKLEIVCPNRATLAQRKDILAYAKNLAAHASVSALVVDFDPPT